MLFFVSECKSTYGAGKTNTFSANHLVIELSVLCLYLKQQKNYHFFNTKKSRVIVILCYIKTKQRSKKCTIFHLKIDDYRNPKNPLSREILYWQPIFICVSLKSKHILYNTEKQNSPIAISLIRTLRLLSSVYVSAFVYVSHSCKHF